MLASLTFAVMDLRSGLSLILMFFEWVTHGTVTDHVVLDACPGYAAQAVVVKGPKLTADLVLEGKACNVFGTDIESLKLEVTYETETRIHLKITDPSTMRYEVPQSVLPRPGAESSISPKTAAIRFNFTASPFTFSIYRASTSEVLFSTASHPLIFEPQYLRLKTNLPTDANIYGLGEHTETFRLPTHNFTRTLWSRDAYGVPNGTNLYGNHPVYFEHRTTGTHGVFLVNSNGMDIKINDTSGTTLEYNVIGGILDFYFLAGSETDPTELVRQYAEIVGTPAEVPYWSFGFHQCRFGYQNFVDVANVITNYSVAEIPLETMWTDIGDRRLHVQTPDISVDPDYFPLTRMREIVDYLHSHDQRYILMTDPAVAYLPGEGYGPYDRGTADDIWLKAANGSFSLGAVWPGVTVFPDWFNSEAQDYWSNEFALFYNSQTGLDIDGAWIDMNEPSSFCNYPCTDPFAQAVAMDLPPARTTSPPDPNTPIFTNATSAISKRVDHSGDNVQDPPYAIANAAGALSNKTAYTDAKHANGLIEYDTHNLYGTMMSTATHNAMLSRRPGLRTLVITRSTFAGAGSRVGKWLGDNFSDWEHYRNSIAGILCMASVFHVPMVGADICGYAEDTTETLCARWAMLGAFYPFMRDHNADTSISQEFYRWPIVTQAAKNVLDIRYRLLDYIYTAFHQAHLDGTPVLNPLWYKYPQDPATFPIDLQFFFGDSILVSPVTEENATSVSIYLPNDVFYDFGTLAPVQGHGSNVVLDNVDFVSIPVHIRGGGVLPLRAKGAMTTTALRETDFEFVVAPGTNGKASGSLYLDDGISISPKTSTKVTMSYEEGNFTASGSFEYATGVHVARVRFLGVSNAPHSVKLNGRSVEEASVQYDSAGKVLDISLGISFDSSFNVQFN
ncbi:putative alpha/beta-glucosidase agdC [Grifola frondosa]|uniref:beta-glucosidase n=1 Tax=Grifola frondosa TaxID=5627 RepID=A0A1C7MH75_GRIFR|nr:putative alpha/beta-glucosidase agdC [Grifola frondosa]